jgi:hypothetical protein
MMDCKNDSRLRPVYTGYSHKTLRNTEIKALGNAKDRGECVWMARLGAGSGPYADLASYGDASAASN